MSARFAVGLALVLAACATPKTAASADAPAPPKETKLAQLMREETERNAPLAPEPGTPLAALGTRSFLFVSGFLSEVIGGYFEDNAAVAKELGATTSVLSPSSTTAMSDEADQLRQAVLDRRQLDGRSVVLVGHSMGGAAALLCALRYPELMLDGTLDRVVVIQGAVGGSPLADTLAHGPVTRLAGIQSLTRAEARALFEKELAALEQKTTDAERRRLFSRVFYVRSAQKEHVVAELKAGRALLSLFGSGDSDGLMLEEDMKLPLGVDLGVLEADHAGLTVSGMMSNTTPLQRKAFTRALLRLVAGP